MKFLLWLIDFFSSVKMPPPMTPDPVPTPTPPTPITPPVEAPSVPQDLLWSTPENARHSVRVICDEEGLTYKQKDDLSRTVHCESGYQPKLVHPNVVNGKVSTIDYGIAQINDYWHIGPGKDFPSKEYVLANPEACIRWMAREWKAGRGRQWVCYAKGMSEHYSA